MSLAYQRSLEFATKLADFIDVTEPPAGSERKYANTSSSTVHFRMYVDAGACIVCIEMYQHGRGTVPETTRCRVHSLVWDRPYEVRRLSSKEGQLVDALHRARHRRLREGDAVVAAISDSIPTYTADIDKFEPAHVALCIHLSLLSAAQKGWLHNLQAASRRIEVLRDYAKTNNVDLSAPWKAEEPT